MKKTSIARYVAAAAVSVASLTVAAPAPAQATIIDTDGVSAMYGGSGITGTVYWRNYNDGFAQLTVHNPNDGYCVIVQDRVWRNGAYGPWRYTGQGTFCTQSTYSVSPYTSNTGVRIYYWQFRTRPAYTNTWTYETNSPGGA